MNRDTESEADVPITRAEHEKLLGRIASLENTHRITSSILGAVIAGLALGLLGYIGYAQGKFDETAKKTDAISVSNIPTSDLLKKGDRCFDTSVEAVAAQVRILDAAAVDGVNTRLSRWIAERDRPYSMIPPEGPLAMDPSISKVENRDGRVCFTLTYGFGQ
ncbi:hypothetical protein [Mycobacteroides abscessus]|uniref:hypothetical protein n=1 Tax=Mycobacteroides abscessus TaxID=36809 RepID=UPI000318181C|nr:hypothetical protein [Mycobacteroides abscessus]